jgi:phosphatidylserine/phosphatidylglycerophosphate/cardiolipin synthase-like enzyme
MTSIARTIAAAACLTALSLSALPARVSAQGLERMCDPGWEDCRAILIGHIRAENTGLDVAFWFMEDAWIASEVIARHSAGVPVRVLMDTEANASNPINAHRLAELRAAGIPMRERVARGILHWKMMLFAGQGIVEFSAANYSSDAWVYSGSPGTNYVDEAIYFTNDSAVVNTFRTRFDDLWTNTTQYAHYANIAGPLMRRYSTFAKDPELNFPPLESFYDRSQPLYFGEMSKIDVTIYRITDQRHTNAMIAARQRGVPIRIISDPQQYRDPNRLWHSWNIDRLYMAGISIRMRAHAGLNHQKTTLLYSHGIAINGSSNWTSPSDDSQEEHNYFTRKPHIFSWLVNQFERKWNNAGGVAETAPFTPLPPDAALSPAPAAGVGGVATSGVMLRWHAGFWAHKYDIYFGTSANPPLLAADQTLGPSHSADDFKQYTLPLTLVPGTTYYWRIVSKTMADRTAASDVWSFTTAAPPPDRDRPSLFWRHSQTGELKTWHVIGTSVVDTRALSVPAIADTNWKIVGTGDLNGDGFTDLVWRNDVDGALAAWFLQNNHVYEFGYLSIAAVADRRWHLAGVGDTDGDRHADLVWQHSDGSLGIWFMRGTQVLRARSLSIPRLSDTAWRIAAVGDINRDGRADLVWHHSEGWLGAWLLQGTTVTETNLLSINRMSDPAWRLAAAGQLDALSGPALVWQHNTGAVGVWYANGFTIVGTSYLTPSNMPDRNWAIVGAR